MNDATKNVEVAEKSVSLIEEIDNNLKETQHLTEEVKENLISITQTLKEVSSSINQTVDEGKFTTDKMKVVDKYSKSISKILRKIENTIIQTTMLAVSGSIEAARAGDFGKGFAVVSADIRNLAQDSQVNLEKIVDIILELDENIKDVSLNWDIIMKSQINEANDIVEIAHKFDSVTKDVIKVSEMLSKLIDENQLNRSALQEATQGNQQIQQAAELAKSNVNESKSAANLILTTIEEMGNLVEELAVLADELQQG